MAKNENKNKKTNYVIQSAVVGTRQNCSKTKESSINKRIITQNLNIRMC